MAHDAFAPGPGGNYPWFPRLPDGSPDWRAVVGKEAIRTDDGRWLTTQRTTQRLGQDSVLIDLTPRDADGAPLVIPVLS